MGRRYFWVAGIALLAVLFLAVVGGVVSFLLIATAAGWIEPREWFQNRANFPGPSNVRFPRALGLCWGLLPILFVAFIISRIVRRFTRPVAELIDAASRVEAGDYAARVSERGPREMRSLARSFNAMTTRLQTNDEQRRAMLADVTHELRTPLTIIQGNLEGLMDGLYPRDDAHLDPILEETHVMSRLIDDLRTLALAESGNLKLEREPTDIGVLIRDVLASYQSKADAAQVQLSAAVPENMTQLEIDPVRVRGVLSNLVGNALRYTPAGGAVEVVAEAVASHIKTTVRDTGKGIAPEALPHIFDRFYKGRDSAGSGLGLAIAKQLVAAHGGEMHAQSVLGAGTVISFTLPMNAAADPRA
jgi:signal transduction histidine kinase